METRETKAGAERVIIERSDNGGVIVTVDHEGGGGVLLGRLKRYTFRTYSDAEPFVAETFNHVATTAVK